MQPPFIDTTKYSPEGATDRQQSIACHPFGVPFNHYHLCRGSHPCLYSAVPVGDLMGKQFINNHRTTTLSEINIPGCKSKTRHNIQHTDNPKVRRTVRLQAGVQPPYIIATKQKPRKGDRPPTTHSVSPLRGSVKPKSVIRVSHLT